MLKRTVGCYCLSLQLIRVFFIYLLYLDSYPDLDAGEGLVLGTTLHAHMEVMKRWYGLSSAKTKHKFL